MNAASNSCHYFRSSFAAIPCCLYSTACWKKSFVAFVLEQIRKSLFHIWINTSFEDLWKKACWSPQRVSHLLEGISHRLPKQFRPETKMLVSKAVSGLATGQPWKRAFCSSSIAGHVSFCTNKYSVVKKKDPVVCSSAAMMLSSPSVNTSMHTKPSGCKIRRH